MKTATLILLSMLALPAVGQTLYKCPNPDGKPIFQQEECPSGAGADTKIDMGVIAKKVIPLYINYSKIKSAIERIRKEPQLAQMNAMDIQNAIQKQFDFRDVDKVQARDLKIRNSPSGRVIDLFYVDEMEIIDGTDLFVVLKIEEEIPLTPKVK